MQKQTAPIERVKAFFGMHDARANSRGFYPPVCCPAHDDKRPSMSYWETPSGGVGFNCQAGCAPEEIRAALKLDLRPKNGYQPAYRPQTASTSLIELAQAKMLDWQMLLNWGVTDDYRLPPEWRSKYSAGQDCIRIGYRDRNSEEATKIRIRTGTSGHDSYWIAETPGEVIPYGMWKLEEAEAAGYLCLVEGESDCWTLWSYGLPALGVPGANMTKCLDGQALASIPKIYIFQEPDQEQKAASLDRAGQGFYSGVYRQLRQTGYKGLLYQVRFKRLTGSKDPNELHQKLYLKNLDLTEFRSEIARVLSQADPANDETEKIQSGLSAIEKALADKDLKAIYEHADTLAALAPLEYALLKIRLKETFEKKINLNDLERVVSAVRSTKIRTTGGYEKGVDGMVHINGYNGEETILSNFTAEIIADIKIDDGAESTRSYAVQATLSGKTVEFEVPAKDFSKCDWVDSEIGAKAWITPGRATRDHLVNAIKSCSDAHEKIHYSHTGWRKIDGQMVYLHAGGVLSQVSQRAFFSNGYLTQKSLFSQTALQAVLQVSQDAVSQVSQVNQGISICLTGPLANYELPENSMSLQEAIRSSLGFVDLTTDLVTMPLYAALWRSALGQVDFGVHLAGQTGYGKTELAAQIQQHFGASLTAHNLPGSWESTENSLEMLLFQAKDTLLVIDDFKPKGPRSDQDRLHAKADRVFRQIGNGAARGRLNPHLGQRAERRPRCLLLSTGEDIPRGQSLKARSVVLLMNEPLTVDPGAKRLAEAQKRARKGLYAQAMAAYLVWLAPRIEAIQSQISDLVAEQRDTLKIEGHARATSNTANMLLGMKCFLQFAYEVGAITENEAHAYLKRCVTALMQVAQDAARENASEKPTEQWVRLIQAAIAAKRAHLVDAEGHCPGQDYGWTIRASSGDGDEIYIQGGDQIGWIVGENIYLQPAAAYKVAKEMGSAIGDEITTLEGTLRKFLVQDGLLASTDLQTSAKSILVRRRFNGGPQQRVLHLKVGVFYPDDNTPSTVDSLDSLDSGPCGPASEAVSELSQVAGQKGSESSETLDSPLGSEPEVNLSPDVQASKALTWLIDRGLPTDLEDRIQAFVAEPCASCGGRDWVIDEPTGALVCPCLLIKRRASSDG